MHLGNIWKSCSAVRQDFELKLVQARFQNNRKEPKEEEASQNEKGLREVLQVRSY